MSTLRKLKTLALLVQLGHEGRLGPPQAVAAEVEVGHLDIPLDLFQALSMTR